VSHFEGTNLVIEHVEKYSPPFSSSDITGKAPFRFKDDGPHEGGNNAEQREPVRLGGGMTRTDSAPERR
jgi:hypothetical protein